MPVPGPSPAACTTPAFQTAEWHQTVDSRQQTDTFRVHGRKAHHTAKLLQGTSSQYTPRLITVHQRQPVQMAAEAGSATTATGQVGTDAG